jgi:serine protease
MKQLSLLALSMLTFLLAGCTPPDDKSSACSSAYNQDSGVRISVVQQQFIAPATWIFEPVENFELISYQWSFSDDPNSQVNPTYTRTAEHTFEEPGRYRVCLRYTTEGGAKSSVESEVVIGAGSISGTITAALNTDVDVDTRDPNEPYVNNNSFDTAQIISSSTRLSGVVDQYDREDFYQVHLQSNQRITLSIAEEGPSGFGAVRLALYSATTIMDNQTVADITVETDLNSGQRTPVVIAPNTGSYYIKVSAINPRIINHGFGPSVLSHNIYSLAIDAPDSAASSALGSYALDEVNIMLKADRQYQAQGLSTKMDLGRIKTLTLADAQAFLTSQNMTVANRLFVASSSQNISAEYRHWQTLQVIEALASHPDILYAEPNWKRYPAALSAINDPYYSAQWHYNMINVPQAWQVMDSRGASDVIVAVLDTGVLTSHPDLLGNLVAGHDFVDNDADANDPGDKSINGQRSSFHGTHVAGTIAASAANGIGGVGIAAGVKVMPVRVLGQGGGFASDIMKGVCYAAGLSTQQSGSSACNNTSAASTASDVINLSLGGPGYSNIENALYNEVIAKGIIVIAAAGNESTSAAFYPASYDNVISVSAVNKNREQANYSNFGENIDIAAPGGDFLVDSGILSTLGDDQHGTTELIYGSLQGTSMAAPHVAGVVALMKSVKPTLTQSEFLTHLKNGELTQDLGDVGRDDIFGWGLVDAQKAILLMQEAPEPQILSSNNRLFFNVSQSLLNFTLTAAGVDNNAALGEISVQIVGGETNVNESNTNESSSNVRWLSLDKNSGLGGYQITVDRTGLSEGIYQAELVVSSSLVEVADITINVQLQVGNSNVFSNAGVQYVFIIQEDAEPDADGNLYSAALSPPLVAFEGKYRYHIRGLKKGRYFVSTGSDLDLDDFICEPGESCGQYPTLEQPKVVIVSEEQSSAIANMAVGYSNMSRANSSVNTVDNKPGLRVRKAELDQAIKSEGIDVKVRTESTIKVIKGN